MGKRNFFPKKSFSFAAWGDRQIHGGTNDQIMPRGGRGVTKCIFQYSEYCQQLEWNPQLLINEVGVDSSPVAVT